MKCAGKCIATATGTAVKDTPSPISEASERPPSSSLILSSPLFLLSICIPITMQVAQILSDLTSLQVCVGIPSTLVSNSRTNQPRIITTPSPSSPSTTGFPATTRPKEPHPRRNLHPSTPRNRRSTTTSVVPRSWWSYTTRSRHAMRVGWWTTT